MGRSGHRATHPVNPATSRITAAKPTEPATSAQALSTASRFPTRSQGQPSTPQSFVRSCPHFGLLGEVLEDPCRRQTPASAKSQRLVRSPGRRHHEHLGPHFLHTAMHTGAKTTYFTLPNGAIAGFAAGQARAARAPVDHRHAHRCAIHQIRAETKALPSAVAMPRARPRTSSVRTPRSLRRRLRARAVAIDRPWGFSCSTMDSSPQR